MKKSFFTVILGAGLLAGCCSSRAPGLPQPDTLRATMQGRLIWDMRWLFRPEKQIDEMEARRVCWVEITGIPTAKGEVFVGAGQPLKTVVRSFRGSEYDGQIRVVSRDAITQTPRLTYEPQRQEVIQVAPGDLVFIQKRE